MSESITTDIYSLIAGVGAGFSRISPNHRPFSLTDPDISFPFVEKEKVSSGVLAVVGLVAPAVIIFAISLIFVPGPTVRKGTPRTAIFKSKLWEWNTGWLGLALALASVFFFTEGMKNLYGKPRPDLLSRCDPDLGAQQSHTLGGFGGSISNGVLLVSSTICRQKDRSKLDDGFSSFPSGHSSCKNHDFPISDTPNRIFSFLGRHDISHALRLLEIRNCHPLPSSDLSLNS